MQHLDPQAARLLQAVARSGQPPMQTLPIEQARRVYLQTRLALQPAAPPVAGVTQVLIPGPGGPLALTVFTPDGLGSGGSRPALVFLHGGGWSVGDIRSYQILCRQLAVALRSVVIYAEYRLAPEHPFPAALDDAWAAVCWTFENAAALGLDRSRIGIGGDSAGGNLAAVAALLARDAGGMPPLRYQVLIYPCVDLAAGMPSHFDLATGFLLTRETYLWYLGNYLRSGGDAHDWRASPLRAPSHAGLPPAIIVTAGFDPLRDEGEAYVARLRAAGVPVTHLPYRGMIHGFIAMGGVLDTARQAIEAVANAVAALIAG